jgi:hypothetical protein
MANKIEEKAYNILIGLKKSIVRSLPIIVMFNAASLINWLPATYTEMTVGSLIVFLITLGQNYLKFKWPKIFNVGN